MTQDIFILEGPACAGEQLLNYKYYQVSERRKAFFSRMKWAVDLIRGFHERIVSIATPVLPVGAHHTKATSATYYVPSFFALLIALHDEESLHCLVKASAALTASNLYWRNLGYDHFYVHGMEYPVVTDFDFAFGQSRPRKEATLWMVQAFYASTRNMVTLTTGELEEGPGRWALAANLYNARRVVNVPFTLHEDCEEEKQERVIKLSFAGSAQVTNHERVLLLRAAEAEFPVLQSGGLWLVKNKQLHLRVLAQLNTSAPPLNHTQRLQMRIQRSWLQKLYRKSQMCVVAPGDAPALGQRLSDVLAAGCIPVVLLGPGARPLLPLQGTIPWEDFAVLVRLGDDVAGMRWALRRLWSMSLREIQRRRQKLLLWRPHLASSFAAKCSSRGEVQPNVAELALQEVLRAQAIWRWQLPFGSLEINSSLCGRGPAEGLQPRCGILKELLPLWG